MTAVFKRELHGYYTGMTGYIAAAFLLVFIGLYSVTLNLTYGYPNFEYVLDSMNFVYMVLIPMLTMRLVAEERKQRTDLLLYALPLSSTEVVIGKYLAACAVLALPLLVSGCCPLLLGRFGEVNYATAYASLLAFFLLGCALTAVGMFVSSLTDNQAVAGIGCFLVLLVDFYTSRLAGFVSSASYASFLVLMAAGLVIGLIVYLMTKNTVAALAAALVLDGGMLACYLMNSALFGGLMGKILSALCVFSRMTGFIDGVFDWGAIVYFLSAAAVFLFLTVQSLEKRRWS